MLRADSAKTITLRAPGIPIYTQMQFWALYNNESSNGLYFGTQDPTPNMTHILVDNTPSQILWSVSHFPPNMSFANEDFAISYDVIAGPFRGDWYDACQIYRKWALQQTWCRKGPLSTREDIPKWYKETPFFFNVQACDSVRGTHSTEKNHALAAADMRKWLEWTGVGKLPVNWYSRQQSMRLTQSKVSAKPVFPLLYQLKPKTLFH